ncbi:hypothetical protein JCM8547_000544 [Rhodosporidiobolus lusitaniae]
MSLRFISFAVVGLLAGLQLIAAAPLEPRTWYRSLSTPHGDISGLSTADGTRYTVPYAQPPTGERRFLDPVALSAFSSHNGAALANVCPQSTAYGNIGDEDCLYMNVYTPPNAASTSKLPVFFWVHGGSFISGGASNLDASEFAKSQNAVVVVVQYRLGALGWILHSGSQNMGLKDVIMALKFVQSDISAYGGDPSKVTLAGQSSGAEIVKSLLVTPSATSLYARAILQSAPLDTADQSPAVGRRVSNKFRSLVSCGTLACLQNLDLDVILNAQNTIINSQAADQTYLGYDVAFNEPIRTIIDGSLIPRDWRQAVSSGQLEGSTKEIIFTTTKDEGCASIFALFPNALPLAKYGAAIAQQYVIEPAVEQAYHNRKPSILASGLYNTSTLDSSADLRDDLLRLVTDYSWVCSNQKSALGISSGTGFSQKVYLGEFDLGVSFYKDALAYCVGKINHQDDIYTIFSRGDSLTSVQQALVSEVRARWGAFIKTGVPTASGYSAWPTVSAKSGDLNVLVLGGTGNGKSTLSKAQRTEQCAAYTYT